MKRLVSALAGLLVVTGVMGATAACVPAPSGLVAWWKGESNTVDSVGFLTGQYLPAQYSWSYTTGKVGAAFRFNQGSYVQIPARPMLNLGDGEGFTIEGWIRPDSFQGGPVAEWNDGVQTSGARLAIHSGGPGVLEARLTATNVFPYRWVTLRSETNTVSNLVWQHVALTFDKTSGLATLYHDGLLVAQTNLGTFTPATVGDFYLGRGYFQGGLDEFSLYDRALTPAEVQAIVAADAAGKCVPPPAPIPSACLTASAEIVGWWRGESNTVDSVSFNHGVMWPTNVPVGIRYAPGMFGNSFSLRVGNYVVIPASEQLDVGKGPGFTVEAWVNPYYSSVPILEWSGGTNTQGMSTQGVYLAYSAALGPGYLEANLVDTQGQSHLIRSPFIPPVYNQWRHVAVTYDQATGAAALFVNGSPVTQTNLGLFTPRTTGNVYLGFRPPGNYPGSGQRFNGWMDEVTVYRRALTPEELQCVHFTGDAGKYRPPPCVVAGADIASWWRGESNVLDSVAMNHGVMVPTNLPPNFGYTNGPNGDCFSLRSGNYVLIPASAGLDVGTGSGLTVEAWVNALTTSFPIAEWYSGHGTQGVYLAYSYTRGAGYLEANLVDHQGQSHVVLSPYIPPVLNQWRHVAVTYDQTSGQAVLFVNGSPVTQTNLGSFTPRTTGNLYLGYRPPGYYPGAGQRFNGLMDEVTVYRRALTLSELRCVYLAGAAGKYPAPVPCVPPAEGIVGWWRGESNTVDSVANNSGMALQSPQPAYTNGWVGSAFATRVGSYVTLARPPGLNVGAGPGLTVEAWINPGQLAPGTIAGWAGSTSPSGVALEYSIPSGQRNLRATLVDSSGLSRVVASPSGILQTGQWQHVALTYDRASGWATLFVNGAPVTATNLGSFTLRTTGDFYMGWRPGGSSFVGGVDEVAVYDRALSSLDINAIYRALNGRCMAPPMIVTQPAAVQVNEGGDATFSVVAAGNPRLRYQWHQGDPQTPVLVPGAINPTLVLSNAQASQTGWYFVRVTNAFGVANSTSVWLRVNRPPLADATATRSPVIVPSPTNALVVLDGTRSSDPDGDPLEYVWLAGETSSVIATGRVAVVTLPLGTNHITLRLDDGLAQDEQTITVEVLTTTQALERLITETRDSVRRSQPLVAVLSAALAAIDRSSPTAAIHQLGAFQNQLRAQVLPADPVLAEQLMQQAQMIMDSLAAPVSTADSPPRIAQITRKPEGKLAMKIHGKRGMVHLIEASSDLVNWHEVGVATERGDGAFDFEDLPSAPLTNRYYRVVRP